MLFLGAAAALGFLVHNAWYMHHKSEEQNRRIRDLEQKAGAAPAAK